MCLSFLFEAASVNETSNRAVASAVVARSLVRPFGRRETCCLAGVLLRVVSFLVGGLVGLGRVRSVPSDDLYFSEPLVSGASSSMFLAWAVLQIVVISHCPRGIDVEVFQQGNWSSVVYNEITRKQIVTGCSCRLFVMKYVWEQSMESSKYYSRKAVVWVSLS